MKYQSSITKQVHELVFDELNSKKRYKCPECISSDRKNPHDLQYYPDTKTAWCFKCNTTFFEYNPHKKTKDYVLPEWKNKTNLIDEVVRWFIGRMISQNTLIKMKVYSDREYMPQFQEEIDVICFPMFKDDKLINVKYRGRNKTFKLASGAELIWYNYNALKSNESIIIVEGEIDLLTWIENGYDNVISVPNGAGPNVEYLDNSIGHFDIIKKVYLATDTDTKGIELRDELARRIGPEKCYMINFKECKDSNDYFCKYGVEFKNLIKDARPVPIKGIIKIDSLLPDIIDLYENGLSKGLDIDFNEIDQYVTWEFGRLAIVTGIPSSGKSEFVDYLVVKLNIKYGYKAAYFTPENYPLKIHYAKIHEKISGKKFKKIESDNFYTVYEYIKDNFHYILNEDDMKVETILASAKSLIRQYGVKILVIDPYNKLEHIEKIGESETKYINKFLNILTDFARFNDVLIFLVAHPVKLQKGEVPNLYSISGSAHFYNRCDYGFTVDRKRDDNNLMLNEIDVHWQKIRFRNLGEQGISSLIYNYNNGRFEKKQGSDVTKWDNSCWLNKDTKIENWYEKENEDENPPF